MLAYYLFISFLIFWHCFFRLGSSRFWHYVSDDPETAIQWMIERPEWVVLMEGDSQENYYKSKPEFIGPFVLANPTANRFFTLYVEEKLSVQSEEEFIKYVNGVSSRGSFPVWSAVACLYPITASYSICTQGASVLIALGYSFSNLAYLLFAATLIPGSFKFLGLYSRSSTCIVAVASLIIGVLFSSM